MKLTDTKVKGRQKDRCFVVHNQQLDEADVKISRIVKIKNSNQTTPDGGIFIKAALLQSIMAAKLELLSPLA